MRVDIGTTTQKYRVIYADPPWKFSSKEAFELRNGGSGFTPLEAVYPTMTTADLKALDVGRLANKDAALFLWATDAHLPDALELFKAWGFRYVTVAFVWAKKTVTGKSAANLAPWTLKNCELCLMGTRGRMVQYKQKNNVQQLVEAVRTRHSEKPEEVRQRIEALFGDVPRLELFARRHSPRVGRMGKRGVTMTATRTTRKPASIRTLWAIAKSPELHLSDEDLHAVVFRETGKESMKKLSQGEINEVARVLQNMKDSVNGSAHTKRTDTGGDARTVQQRRKIFALTEELGWNGDPRRIQGFAKRLTGVDRLEWLNVAQCEKVIEGLKAMVARQKRKEAQV